MDSENSHPVMLVGTSGSGKNTVIHEKLRSLRERDIPAVTINCNAYMDATVLQQVMEQSLEKKLGSRYGPRSQKRLVYYIHDVNMSAVDKVLYP